MNNLFFAFIITTIAGFSTMLGCLSIFFNDKKRNKIIVSSLSFSSGAMIFISLYDLIPSSYKYITSNYTILYSILIILFFIILGFIITYLLDHIIVEGNDLYKIGLISMITLMIHNIPEGIITFVTTANNVKIGLPLAFSIALHNIPEGISIFIPIYYGTGSKLKAFKYTFIAGFSELLGAVLAYFILSKYITDSFLASILAITAGIMLCISMNTLIPRAIKDNKIINFIKYFLLGSSIILLTELI